MTSAYDAMDKSWGVIPMIRGTITAGMHSTLNPDLKMYIINLVYMRILLGEGRGDGARRHSNAKVGILRQIPLLRPTEL